MPSVEFKKSRVKRARSTLSVLFPGARAKLMVALFTRPSKQRYVRELRGITGLALSTVQHELRKLKAMGLLVTWSNGYHRFYRANGGHPLVRELIRVIEIAAQSRVDESGLTRRNAHRRTGQARRVRRHDFGPSPPGWGIFRAKPKA